MRVHDVTGNICQARELVSYDCGEQHLPGPNGGGPGAERLEPQPQPRAPEREGLAAGCTRPTIRA